MLSLLTSGRKRRFGIAGVINIIATNILLQGLLASHSIPLSVATLTSQIFNGVAGFLLYGKWVFRHQNLSRWQKPTSYLSLMTLLWSINTLGIHILNRTLLIPNRNMAAAAMVAPLAIISYSAQKSLVFKA
jgi:putative flippase GtrA